MWHLQCNDPCDLPTIQYNFVSIGDLSNCSGNDIIGWYFSLHSVEDILTFFFVLIKIFL